MATEQEGIQANPALPTHVVDGSVTASIGWLPMAADQERELAKNLQRLAAHLAQAAVQRRRSENDLSKDRDGSTL